MPVVISYPIRSLFSVDHSPLTPYTIKLTVLVKIEPNLSHGIMPSADVPEWRCRHGCVQYSGKVYSTFVLGDCSNEEHYFDAGFYFEFCLEC